MDIPEVKKEEEGGGGRNTAGCVARRFFTCFDLKKRGQGLQSFPVVCEGRGCGGLEMSGDVYIELGGMGGGVGAALNMFG